MIAHPHFPALTLHDDTALAAVLGAAVVRRATLAEWPLSCVQRVWLADGRTVIYKAQAQPTVEPEFYAAARGPALVAAQVLPHLPTSVGDPLIPRGLLLADVRAPRLADLGLPPTAAQPVAAMALDAIAILSGAAVAGDLPALHDLRTPAGWTAYAGALQADLDALAEAGVFREMDAAAVSRVVHVAGSPAVQDALATQAGYVHGDLRGENIFLVQTTAAERGAPAGGLKIIDWQRPFWGPLALDRASLLESLEVDPVPVVGAGIMALLNLTRIAWLAACARRWFRPGSAVYDAQIAALAAQL